jgi:heme exporter protein C
LIKPKAEDAYRVFAFNRSDYFMASWDLLPERSGQRIPGAILSGDIKQNMTAIALLIYASYFILWKTFKDEQVQLRVSSAFTIFAYVAMIPLLFVIPRLYDSLHPEMAAIRHWAGKILTIPCAWFFIRESLLTRYWLWLSNLFYRIIRMENILKQ